MTSVAVSVWNCTMASSWVRMVLKMNGEARVWSALAYRSMAARIDSMGREDSKSGAGSGKGGLEERREEWKWSEWKWN
jgi:hypothetical protein